MSTLLAPLYQLLKSSTGWQWTEKQEETFQKSKKVLTSSSVLIHFDSNLDIILFVDASAYGVGAILAHKMPNGSERPVAFASRTLSCSEKNYSQIEKEALACVFGVKKIHQYLYGHHFTLITDHKPLIQLLNGQSTISTQASARIQRWTLTLSSYECSIIFRSSEENANADAMSRLPVKECVPDAPNPAETVRLLEHLKSSAVNVSQIRNRTHRDPLLSRVYRFVMEGWTAQVDQDLLPFSKRKEERSTMDGCLLWGQGSTDLSWKDGQLRLIKTYYLSQNGRRNGLQWMDVYFGVRESLFPHLSVGPSYVNCTRESRDLKDEVPCPNVCVVARARPGY